MSANLLLPLPLLFLSASCEVGSCPQILSLNLVFMMEMAFLPNSVLDSRGTSWSPNLMFGASATCCSVADLELCRSFTSKLGVCLPLDGSLANVCIYRSSLSLARVENMLGF